MQNAKRKYNMKIVFVFSLNNFYLSYIFMIYVVYNEKVLNSFFFFTEKYRIDVHEISRQIT